MDHVDIHKILKDYQHGFRFRHSCETQLINTIEDLAKGLDNHQQMDLLILDFSKAFDTVAHQRLIKKLDYYGIRDETLLWITNWLTGRTQQVVVDGDHSVKSPVRSGVPQGTVLGPLMFILYINDIGDGTTSNIRLFADDCLLYRTISNKQDSRVLQNDLDTMCNWAKIWQMHFNPDKCSVLRVTRKRKSIDTKYVMLGKTLNQVQHRPYLGVEFSHNLSWDYHIKNVSTKGHRILNFLRRNLSGCSQDTKSQAYKSLVRPGLEYAGTAWDPYQTKDIYKLEAVQRRAARFVTGNYIQEASVTNMLNQLN